MSSTMMTFVKKEKN